MNTPFGSCVIKNAPSDRSAGRSVSRASLLARRSLTQHSRPRRLDRLFSPNQVEVLQRERDKGVKINSGNGDGGEEGEEVKAQRRATSCVCLSVQTQGTSDSTARVSQTQPLNPSDIFPLRQIKEGSETPTHLTLRWPGGGGWMDTATG